MKVNPIKHNTHPNRQSFFGSYFWSKNSLKAMEIGKNDTRSNPFITKFPPNGSSDRINSTRYDENTTHHNCRQTKINECFAINSSID